MTADKQADGSPRYNALDRWTFILLIACLLDSCAVHQDSHPDIEPVYSYLQDSPVSSVELIDSFSDTHDFVPP